MTADSHKSGRPALEERFNDLLRRLGMESIAGEAFPVLAALYGEPGRYYHTLDHVGDCLARLDEIRGRLSDPEGVELALWFHDVVHDPARDDNELQSALLFDRQVGVHLPTARADRVHAMIMTTTHDGRAPADDDARWTADIDLQGLAAPWPEFLEAAAQLRREYAHAAGPAFEVVTQRFFTGLLQRSVFLTDCFRTRYEDRARRNMSDWLAGCG